jgi:outer membrane protein OmpA-like peptidoglycan-associated protein
MLAGTVLSSATASAQQKTFHLDRIQVPGAPDDGLVAWRPYFHEKTRLHGSLTLGYTLNPLRAETLTDRQSVEARIEDPLDHHVVSYMSAGMEFSGRFGFAFQLPVVLFQDGGRDPQEQGIGFGLDRAATVVGDLRLDGKVRAFQSDNRNFLVSFGAAFFAPTGNATSFASDDQATAFLYGATEYNFGKFLVTGHIGPHFRPNRGIHGANGVLDVGSELRWGGTIFLPMRQGDVRLGGSLWGTTGIQEGATTGQSTFFNGRNTDIEWLGEVRFLLKRDTNWYATGGGGTRLATGYGAPDIRLLAQIGTWTTLPDFGPGQEKRERRKTGEMAMYDKDTDGDGYPDDIDLCPTEKEDGKPPRADDGCPGMKDRDGDGIPDDVDKCPDDPEDRDGIQDGDGCPETDADNDGILDVDDACPLVAGVKSKDPKKNGCKAQKIVEVDGKLQLLEPIQFDTGRATIKAVSFPILDEVVEVLASRQDVRMGIYGYTDSRGARAMNTNLSKARAASVVEYLVRKGIARSRLESDGFGPDKPIDSNETEEGRAKNRRVEFKLIE